MAVRYERLTGSLKSVPLALHAVELSIMNRLFRRVDPSDTISSNGELLQLSMDEQLSLNNILCTRSSTAGGSTYKSFEQYDLIQKWASVPDFKIAGCESWVGDFIPSSDSTRLMIDDSLYDQVVRHYVHVYGCQFSEDLCENKVSFRKNLQFQPKLTRKSKF
jgi:hypothetical protein